MLTATETAARLGISVRTLDRMEHAADPGKRLAPASRTPGGHRRYEEGQVERVRLGLPAVEPESVAS